MKKPTKKQLEALVIGLSIQHHQSDLAVKRRRYELNEEYACYFRVRGEIEPGFRGIRPMTLATRVLWRTRRTLRTPSTGQAGTPQCQAPPGYGSAPPDDPDRRQLRRAGCCTSQASTTENGTSHHGPRGDPAMTSPSTPPRRSRSALAQRSSMVPGRPTCSSRGLPERERWTIYELAKLVGGPWKTEASRWPRATTPLCAA